MSKTNVTNCQSNVKKVYPNQCNKLQSGGSPHPFMVGIVPCKVSRYRTDSIEVAGKVRRPPRSLPRNVHPGRITPCLIDRFVSFSAGFYTGDFLRCPDRSACRTKGFRKEHELHVLRERGVVVPGPVRSGIPPIPCSYKEKYEANIEPDV